MNKSYYFLNLGCPKNQSDGDFVRGALNDLGFIESDIPVNVDYIFINTCAFIEEARRETEGEIELLLNAKSEYTRMVALGCYPVLPDFDGKRLSLDASFKFNEIEKLLKYVSGNKDYCYRPGQINRAMTGLPYAYLVLSDGCDNRCGYCAIPNIRGSYASRKPESIINEAEYLCANGVKELVLVAQDTAVYGRDLDDTIDLPGLCERLALIEEVEWLRIMYVHPAHIDEAMLTRLFAIDKVCRYLDMPIQHIADEILHKMNRRYNSEHVWGLIKHLRKLDKDISLRTTLMVGFPGETDDDFGKLLGFVENVRFDYLGAFAYSPETGTSAVNLPDHVDRELAGQRLELLYDIAEQISLEKAEAKIGEVDRLLIDDISDEFEDYYIARSAYQAPEIDGNYIVRMKLGAGPGDFVNARIVDVNEAEII